MLSHSKLKNRNRLRRRLGVEAMEDRVTPTASAITSNFNGTAIPAGDTVWFNSVAKVSGLGAGTETLYVTDGAISFTSNGVPYTVDVPDMAITFTALATTASTSFDASGWHVTTPPVSSGNVFLGGAALTLPGGLPGGIKNVTWSANFSADTNGLKVNWQWAAAVYTKFDSSLGSIGVKTVDDGGLDAVYSNSDHAGTPEGFKRFVIGGARGGGGSNFTGSYSGTASVCPCTCVITPPPPPTCATSSLSGAVFEDTNHDHLLNVGDRGLGGIEIDLLDSNGNTLKTTTTAGNGAFGFNNLEAGTYSIQMVARDGDGVLHPFVGTAGGDINTSWTGFTNIQLDAGVAGTSYEMGVYPGGN